jgi:hypothetical protein
MKTSPNRSSSGRKLIVTLAAVTTLCVLSIIVAGLTSLVTLAERIHPVAGQLVFWSVCAALGFLALYALIAYARMPASLVPVAKDSADYDTYLRALRARLRVNPKTAAHRLDTVEEMEKALEDLSAEADLVVRGTASTVFLSTALMQNGRLDGLIVLFTQIRMIWRVARIYVQRPSPRDLVRLYANVAGTAFVASGLESLDLGEMFAPLATSVVPAIKGGIPGLSGISALLVRCISNGAANAFLTLRVGEVARRYCELSPEASPEGIRRSATADAVKHLGRIVRENGALVVAKVWESTVPVFVKSGLAKAEDMKEAARGWVDRISQWRLKESPVGPE